MKLPGKPLTYEYLTGVSKRLQDKGYRESKWITFALYFVTKGYHVRLKASQSTVSKYVIVGHSRKGGYYKVRFSNHKANIRMEDLQDSDIYVGVGNKGTINTGQAIQLTEEWLSNVKSNTGISESR